MSLCELGLRILVFNPNYSYIRTPGWSMNVKQNDQVPPVSIDHTVTINKYGYRGAPPIKSAAPLIILSGGSTTESWIIPDRFTWAEQLETKLKQCKPNVEVANLGKSGSNARHNLLQLEALSEYMPTGDIYVVLMGLNDFLFDLSIHHSFEVEESWWNRQAFMTISGDEGAFALVALVKRLYRRYTDDEIKPQAVSNFGIYLKSLREAYRNVAPNQWIDKLPDLSSHLETYKSTILKLKLFADTHGGEIIFLTQPFVWSEKMSQETKDQLYAGFIGPNMLDPNTRWYTTKVLEEGLMSYNNTLREMCDLYGLNCIDLAKKIPREAQYFYDDSHFSIFGSQTVAEIVVDDMINKLGFCN